MNLVVGLMLAIAGGIVCAISGSPAGVPAIIGGVLQAALTATLRRRTRKGQKWYLIWKNLRGFIRSRALATRTDSLHWENVDRVVVAGQAKAFLELARATVSACALTADRSRRYNFLFFEVISVRNRVGSSNQEGEPCTR